MNRWIGKQRCFLLASVLVVLAFGFPRVGQASILEELAGDLRLRAPVCSAPFVAFDDAPFGSFHVVPDGAGGTVSFTVGGDSLTAMEVAANRVRRVDPLTGRPIEGSAPPGASCTTGIEPDCWVPGEPTAINANAFNAICAPTKGYTEFDLEACVFTVYNSQNLLIPTNPLSPTLAVAFGIDISGQDPDAQFAVTGGALFLALAGYGDAAQAEIRAMTKGNILPSFYPDGVRTPLVPLVLNPNDGPFMNHPIAIQNIFAPYGLSPVLTDEQEALLGCGPFYGTNCDIDGLGLMRDEVGALGQSWPRFDLPFGEGSWNTTDGSKIQPGTVGFESEPVCTRYEGGTTSILPGCRGSGDPGYDIDVDGSTFGDDTVGAIPGEYQRVHPFTGQQWKSEIAIASWNFLMLITALSLPEDFDNPSDTEFDRNDPLRTDGCSFANPVACCGVANSMSYTTRAPEEDPSQPPLARWLWEAGAEYVVTEATGDLEDFLGWTLFAFGPEQSRASGAEVGLSFLISPPDPPPPIPDSPLIVRWAGLDGMVGTADDNFAGIAYGVVTDRDGDGIPDASDNCIEAENASQLDTDGDDYGNACDCDFDQNGACNIADFTIFREDFIATVDRGVGSDMDASGAVNIADFSLFRAGYVAGEPGPKGPVP